MKIHYLEIVSKDVEGICRAYESSQNLVFGEPDELLGGAKTCELPDGSIVGVRSPLRENEDPVVRSYWLVEDIDQAVTSVKDLGAEIALPPTEIPGKGKFAIYLLGSIDHGLWQL